MVPTIAFLLRLRFGYRTLRAEKICNHGCAMAPPSEPALNPHVGLLGWRACVQECLRMLDNGLRSAGGGDNDFALWGVVEDDPIVAV